MARIVLNTAIDLDDPLWYTGWSLHVQNGFTWEDTYFGLLFYSGNFVQVPGTNDLTGTITSIGSGYFVVRTPTYYFNVEGLSLSWTTFHAKDNDLSRVAQYRADLMFAGNDVITGSNGNDKILARDGNDSIDAGVGNDTIFGGNDNDTIRGNDGNDLLEDGIGRNALYGGNGNDTIRGGGLDTVWGDAGDDRIEGGLLIRGGAGNDTITGWDGATVDGGAGIDVLIVDEYSEFGHWTLSGDLTRQTLTSANSGTQEVSNVELFRFRAGEVLTLEQALAHLVPRNGTSGPDTMNGTIYNDTLRAFGDDDLLLGLAGDDQLSGGTGNDTVVGDAGNDQLWGGDGADTLNAGAGNDTVVGGDTAADLRDVIYGGDGNDSLDGGAGNDEISGGNGDDVLLGGFGADTLIGNAGADSILGAAGSDLIFGNDGADFINGGFGFDRINGGGGGDRFFHQGVADHGSDWIQDYAAAQGDVLVMGLAGATRAQLQVNFAHTAGAGSDAVDEAFVIYRPTGQVLWALVDGAGQAHINVTIGGQGFDLLV